MSGHSSKATVEEKMAWARACYRRFGDRLSRDPAAKALMASLGASIQATRKEMERAGITAACRICEEEEGGSCCGAGIEKHYDGILLLINLLLGANLPETRRSPEDCRFLGDGGCLLLTRHVICVNYLCPRITGQADPAALSTLRDLEGVELETVFRLHARIKELLGAIPNDEKPAVRSTMEMDKGLKIALERVARFFDRRKVGDVGALGFRRSTQLSAVAACLEGLIGEGILVPGKSRFLDMGCADGRVNILFSYLVRLSVGVEIDPWTLEEYGPLKDALAVRLKAEGMALPPDNIRLFEGDTLDPGLHRKVLEKTGAALNSFDLFYTYLTLHDAFADLIARSARSGAVFMVYGLDLVLPRYGGLRLLDGQPFIKNKLVLYRKD